MEKDKGESGGAEPSVDGFREGVDILATGWCFHAYKYFFSTPFGKDVNPN